MGILQINIRSLALDALRPRKLEQGIIGLTASPRESFEPCLDGLILDRAAGHGHDIKRTYIHPHDRKTG